uniref:Cathepsin K n=1 Tax=Paramormyrops kingsleyae TaxID=1676925 RepID=A0A3B3R723_9TELE
MIWCGGVLLLPILALANFTQGPSLLLDSEWESWKTVYEKEYNSREEGSRRSIWEKNMRLIDAHNQEYKQGIHSYDLGDMTSEEVTAIMTGLRVPQITESNNTFLPDGDLEKLPKSIDYRKKGYVTPVRHMNFFWWLESQSCHQPPNLSLKGGGLASRSGRRCAYKAWKKVMSCRGYKSVASGNERALQAAVASVGPVSAAISTSLHTFNFYRRGEIPSSAICNRLNHAVLVVGYGSTDRGKYWIIKNSWGKGWGMKGYMHLARNRCNACGIATHASYPI